MARTPLALLCLTLSLIASAASAQKRSPDSEAFVNAAAQSDQYEILSSRLILAESQDQQVRGFAQQMIDHHTQTKATLARAVAAAGLSPPPETLGGDQQAMLGALQSLKGPDLDRAYATQQVNAHTAALVTQKAFAEGGDQPDLKAAARAAVPVIAKHLETAKALQASRAKN